MVAASHHSYDAESHYMPHSLPELILMFFVMPKDPWLEWGSLSGVDVGDSEYLGSPCWVANHEISLELNI